MKYIVHWFKDKNIITVSLHEEVSGSELIELLDRLWHHENYHPFSRQILDFQAVTRFVLGSGDLKALKEVCAARCENMEGEGGALAVVASNKQIYFKLQAIALATQVKGLKTKVFQRTTQAQQWLCPSWAGN